MTRATRIKIVIGCALAAAVAFGVWLLLPQTLSHQPMPAEGRAAVPQHRAAAADASGRGGTAKAGTAPKGGAPAGVNYREALAASHNYRDYAKNTLAAARAGNRDAQFYLFRALDRCQS